AMVRRLRTQPRSDGDRSRTSGGSKGAAEDIRVGEGERADAVRQLRRLSPPGAFGTRLRRRAGLPGDGAPRAAHVGHGTTRFAVYALNVLNAVALAKLLMLPIEVQSSTPAAVRGRRLAIIFLIAAPAVCLAWIRRRAITGIRHNKFTRGTQLGRVAPPEKSLSSPGVLMRNTQTDVVHSTIVCINHLPKKKHRDNELKGGWLHGAHESMILDACAQELEDEMNQVISRSSSRIPARKGRHATPFGISPDQQVKEQREKIVRLIERAISLRPDAYHLYDYLIRIHRESGEVDRAHDALQRQLQRVEANLRIASTQIPKSSVARRHPKSKMLTN